MIWESYETVELNCILSSRGKNASERERKDAKKWILIARKYTVEQTLAEAISCAGPLRGEISIESLVNQTHKLVWSYAHTKIRPANYYY